MSRWRIASYGVLVLAGCGNAQDALPVDAAAIDAAQPDAPPIDKSGACVDSFGNSLTDGFGRLDGTVVAILPPASDCPHSNSTHLILEVRQHGEVYRIVTAVVSTVGNPVMALAERDAALVGPPWQEGWHVGTAFDFVTHMGVHRLDFTPTPTDALVGTITRRIELGSRISVFATVEDADDSAHLIHRNTQDADGAIVLDADTAPHYVMLRFDNQLF